MIQDEIADYCIFMDSILFDNLKKIERTCITYIFVSLAMCYGCSFLKYCAHIIQTFFFKYIFKGLFILDKLFFLLIFLMYLC